MELFTWKEEPVSPAGQDYPEESWLLFEDEEVKFPSLKPEPPLEPFEDVWLPESPSESNSTTSQLSRAELAEKLLVALDDSLLDENDHQSLDWFEQKTSLPIFDELPSPPTPSTSPTHDCPMTFAPMAPAYIAVAPVPVPMEHKAAMFGGATLSPPLAMPLMPMAHSHEMTALMPAQVVPQVQVVPQLVPQVVQVEHTSDTASLLQEFENVYDETVMTLGALTPPQSPPCAPVLHELKVASPRPTKAEMILPYSNDLTELDEIVRARGETIFTSSGPLSEEPASPVTSVSSCAPSLDEPTLDEPSPSPSPSSMTESSDDPDWVPSPAGAPTATVVRGRGRKRAANAKPYARATQEDKKLRKKEQNKNAATRYRLKKKMEVEEILGEEQELQDTNDQLKQRVGELSQEIRYLKDLMRDVCRAKGLIK